jgi:hypothetical protein
MVSLVRDLVILRKGQGWWVNGAVREKLQVGVRSIEKRSADSTQGEGH